jgi:hypothetical protein
VTTSYDVKFWDIRRNKSSKTPSYEIRWKVGGREKSKTLRTKALAESFLSDLRQAAKRGEAFDVDAGLPESMVKAKDARTWLEFARAYVDAKWPHLAAKSRDGLTETMTGVTLALLKEQAGTPDTVLLRTVLRGHVFLPDGRRKSLDYDETAALRWLLAASLPVADLADTKKARAALEALSLRLDGTRAADSTFRRKRAVFHHALEYAVELGELSANPLERINWKPAKVTGEIDRRVVVNPRQARELLTAVTYVGRSRGAMLAAMFACMYYGGLRAASKIVVYENGPLCDLIPIQAAIASFVRSTSLLSPSSFFPAALRHSASTSSPRYRRPSVHSSCCSASTAPTSRTIASRLGKMPTTSVRRRISLFSRSCGLFDQICRHTLLG